MQIPKKIFTGILDFDSEDRFVAPPDYRYALNVRSGSAEDNNIGAITNVLGNTLITVTLPGGRNKVVGTYEDKKFNTIIYMVWNENASHCIFQYIPNLNIVFKILEEPLLNFQENVLITGIALVDGKYLCWNDDYNEPSLLDIEKARNSQYPTPFKRQYIDRIPYPPECSPTAVYDTDNTVKTNNVKGKLFQFKYKFVYFDNRESAWSPISKTPLPPGEIYNSTTIATSVNNRINLTVETGDAIVTKIKIAVREGNLSDFFLVTSLNKSELFIADNSTYTFQFYNDGIYTGISLTDSNSLFDNVPLKSKSLELIDGNRIADGDVLNGFDLTDIKVKVTPVYNDIPTSNAAPNDWVATTLPTQATIVVNNNPANVNFSMSFTIQKGFPNPQQIEVSYSLQTSSSTTKNDIVNFFYNKLISDPKLQLTGINVLKNLTTNTLTIILGSGYTFSGLVSVTTVGYIETVRCFKSGALHKFGIAYYDKANRSSTINRSKDCEVWTDWFSERTTRGHVDMTLSIFNDPPDWATHWQILYTKNQTVQRFIQFTTDSVVINGDFQEISLVNITDFATANPNSILSYDWSKGDRIRLIRGASGTFWGGTFDTEIVKFDSGTNVITINNLALSDMQSGMLFEIYTPKKNVEEVLYREIGECYPIIEVNGKMVHGGKNQNQGSSPIITFNVIDTYSGQTADETELQVPNTVSLALFETGAYVELSGTKYNGLFRIKRTENTFAPVVVIDTPYVGSDQNFSGSALQGAIVEMTNEGDVYFKRREMDNEVPENVPAGIPAYMVEDANFSDFYTSDYVNVGRPNRYDPNAKQQRRPATIYYSEPYISDTNINGLGTVYDLNFEEYDKNYGSIQKMYAEDKAIIVFQQLKVGKVPVFQFQINDTQGQQVMGATEEVLSRTIQYYSGEYGIGFNPESFAVYGNRKYFVDVQRGAVLRLSLDGITPISEYKAHNYFTDRFRDILKRPTRTNIFGVYDVKFGEYVLSLEKKISDTTTINILGQDTVWPIPQFERETIAFNENKNGWVTFYSYQPENIVGSNLDIVSFKEGKLYIHNSNSLFNNFYGVQYNSQVEFVSNDGAGTIKTYDSIETDSSDAWAMELTNQFGQKTSLIESDFENIEWVFWASFWKDENTPNVLNPLFNGDDIRCHSATIKMTNIKTTFTKLFAVGIKQTVSMNTTV